MLKTEFKTSEHQREYRKKYVATHKLQVKALAKKYRDAPEHKQKMKLYFKVYYQTHRPYFREYMKKYHKEHKKKC